MEDHLWPNVDSMSLQDMKEQLTPQLRAICKRPPVENPFKSYLQISFWRKVKIALLCLLVPLRIVLMLISLFISIVWSTVFLIGYTEPDPEEPFGPFRHFGVRGMYLLARINCYICGFHYIKVTGEVDPAARILVVAPHSCAMDVWLLSSIVEFNPVARAEFIGTPLMGNVFRTIQPIYVSRADRNSKTVVLKEMVRRVVTPGWPAVLVFPEGTCTNRTALTSFKPGAFAAGKPVQPIMMRYPGTRNPGGFDYATWGFVGPSFVTVCLLMATNIHNAVEIEVLPLYRPSEEEIADPIIYARNVRSLMATAYGVPTTEHSYEDCRLMMAAGRLKLPMESGVVEYHRVSSLTGMNYNAMVEELGAFAAIDQKHDGVVDAEEFCDYLNLPAGCAEGQSLFELYDVDGDGVIDFREYLLGKHFISERFNTNQNLQLLFDFLQDGVDLITIHSLRKVLVGICGNKEKHCEAIFAEMGVPGSDVDIEKLKTWLCKKLEYIPLLLHLRHTHEF